MKNVQPGFLLFIIVFLFAACAPNEVDFELPIYQETENQELNCMELTYNGITYRPFGSCDKSLLDEKIGVYGDERDVFVWSVKGYDSNQWICDMLETGLMDSPVLLKAIDVTDIPDELLQYDAYDFS